MQKQEMFDVVARHLLSQRSKSFTSIERDEVCAYQGVGGKKCAIGVLIPDELYDPGMEGFTAGHLVEKYPSVAEFISDVDLADDLQSAHDKFGVGSWPLYLRKIAENYELDSTVIAEFAWAQESLRRYDDRQTIARQFTESATLTTTLAFDEFGKAVRNLSTILDVVKPLTTELVSTKAWLDEQVRLASAAANVSKTPSLPALELVT